MPKPDWGHPLPEKTERRLARLADLGERTFSVVLFTGLAVRVAEVIVQRPANAAILLSEGMVVVFMILRRRPLTVSARPLDWLAALAGTAGPMLIRPGGHMLAPPAIGLGLILTGFLLAIWGKLTLRRSFGLTAANRGLVQSGAYNVVRHPIYAGYLLTYIGFFLLNPTARNAALYGVTVGLMIIRIGAEENVLRLDPGYAAFMNRVRYRVAPGLY
ncbi:MAG TPA: methyltransferase [Caulobacteraceae bacterium]